MGRVLVKGAGAVEELEVEGCGCLAVYFSVWGGLHRHCEIWGCECSRGLVVCHRRTIAKRCGCEVIA